MSTCLSGFDPALTSAVLDPLPGRITRFYTLHRGESASLRSVCASISVKLAVTPKIFVGYTGTLDTVTLAARSD